MALINTLLNLKDHGEINNFTMNGDQSAKIFLSNGKHYHVFMSNEYIIGETQVFESTSAGHVPDFIIYNDWDQVTGSAEREAKRKNIKIVKYGRFRYLLADLNG